MARGQVRTISHRSRQEVTKGHSLYICCSWLTDPTGLLTSSQGVSWSANCSRTSGIGSTVLRAPSCTGPGRRCRRATPRTSAAAGLQILQGCSHQVRGSASLRTSYEPLDFGLQSCAHHLAQVQAGGEEGALLVHLLQLAYRIYRAAHIKSGRQLVCALLTNLWACRSTVLRAPSRTSPGTR